MSKPLRANGFVFIVLLALALGQGCNPSAGQSDALIPAGLYRGSGTARTQIYIDEEISEDDQADGTFEVAFADGSIPRGRDGTALTAGDQDVVVWRDDIVVELTMTAVEVGPDRVTVTANATVPILAGEQESELAGVYTDTLIPQANGSLQRSIRSTLTGQTADRAVELILQQNAVLSPDS